MPGMFLRRPFPVGFSDPTLASSSPNDFFEPRRGAAQARAQVWMEPQRKRELKLPFKPDRRFIHGCRKTNLLSADVGPCRHDAICARSGWVATSSGLPHLYSELPLMNRSRPI